MPTYLNPSGEELPKYANLAGRLEADLNELGELHRGRDEATRQLQALAVTRDRLNRSVLDMEAPQATLLENLRELEGEKLLLEAQLSALEPRVNAAETKLHSEFPDVLRCFARLHGRVVTCILDSAKESVTKLLAPGYTVPEDVINQIAIATPGFVEVSQLKLPGLTHILTRDLEFSQPHWSSLVRPFSEAEKHAQRSETIDSLIQAAKALILAARRLIELMQGYPERVPEFRCEPEPVAAPAQPDPKFLEWQTALGGSDEEWLRQICDQAGKPYPPTDPAQIEILAKMLEQRHAHPIAHGIVTGEMLGSTFVP